METAFDRLADEEIFVSKRLKSLMVAGVSVVVFFTGVVYAQDVPAASATESAKPKPRSGSDFHVFTNVAGTGTTNQLVKWTDGAAGTLGDSILTELNGKIGIGTTTPEAGYTSSVQEVPL